jgi:hypothetical protein
MLESGGVVRVDTVYDWPVTVLAAVSTVYISGGVIEMLGVVLFWKMGHAIV